MATGRIWMTFRFGSTLKYVGEFFFGSLISNLKTFSQTVYGKINLDITQNMNIIKLYIFYCRHFSI